MLLIIPLLLLFQHQLRNGLRIDRPRSRVRWDGSDRRRRWLAGGYDVGGSGSIIMMLLLLFYSFPPKVNVGTDIVHAVVLTGITGLLHFRLGNVDPTLVLTPFGWLDSRRADWLTSRHPHAHAMAAPNFVCPAPDYWSSHARGLCRPVPTLS